MIRSRRSPILALIVLALLSTACPFGTKTQADISKIKKKVADAAAILNTAAKSNRSLYQSGTYGAVGSPEAISKRQQVAAVIHQANEYLALAVERAANLTADDLPNAKTDVVHLLQQAVQVLGTLNVNNENIKLVIASAVTAINTAVTLTLAIREGN